MKLLVLSSLLYISAADTGASSSDPRAAASATPPPTHVRPRPASGLPFDACRGIATLDARRGAIPPRGFARGPGDPLRRCYADDSNTFHVIFDPHCTARKPRVESTSLDGEPRRASSGRPSLSAIRYASETGYWKFTECGDTPMPVLALERGQTYTFDQGDESNWRRAARTIRRKRSARPRRASRAGPRRRVALARCFRQVPPDGLRARRGRRRRARVRHALL